MLPFLVLDSCRGQILWDSCDLFFTFATWTTKWLLKLQWSCLHSRQKERKRGTWPHNRLSFQISWPELEHVSSAPPQLHFIIYLFSFIFISWRLITLQYCSGFCHTLTWISHGFTCIPHPDPPSHLPLYPIPLGLPSAPGRSTCLMHPTWAGDLFHPK